MGSKINISDAKYYDNRELSWLKFELRVLNEAMVKELPILERIKFVSITSSNLDEFFMVYFDEMYHYSFVETNQLNGEVLSSNGDYSSSERVNVAIRNYGNYSYKLYIF